MASAGLFWLTRDFRFGDNAALAAAVTDGPLLAVFFVDEGLKRQGAASRWRLECALDAFDAELRRRSGGRGLVILEGEPDDLLPGLLRRSGARRVHQSDWPEPGMRRLQARVREALAPAGGELVLHRGHLLTHPGSVRTGEGGAYKVFSPFARAVRALGPEPPGPSTPDRIEMLADAPEGLDLAALDLAPDLHGGRAALERFALPAGEAAARDRLEAFLDRAGGYAADRDRPDRDATSGLSEHLATGEIGPRTVWAIADRRAETDPGRASAIDKFLSEVIWREFAWHLFIDFPRMARTAWRAEWQVFPWRGENPDLEHWRHAETGIALVDAGLREMWVTGRMHNRVRMVAASWLTKHLLTDWRLGLAHFADCLTDWDPASNAMNWQWVAGCGPDAAPYFRVFNPERQAEKFDPDGRYRRRWLAGWTGEPGAEARAFLDSVPSGWKARPDWTAGPTEALLLEGRDRALRAYEGFRRQ